MSGKKNIEEPGNVTKEVTVTNKLGIHARPASMFVKIATRYRCDILVEKDGETVNGKSIMGLMMLAAGPGTRLRVQARGDDAQRAVTELESLIEQRFGEE